MPVKINLMPQKQDKISDSQGYQSLFYSGAFLLFIISLFAFLGVFAWRNYVLKPDIEKNKARIESLEKEIRQKSKEPFAVANKKAKSVKRILINHLYWSRFYKTLEAVTLKNIFYKDLSVSAADGNSGGIKAKISGEAGSFKELAKQLEVYKESKEIISIEFGRAEVEKSGKVKFAVELIFDSSLLKFDSPITDKN